MHAVAPPARCPLGASSKGMVAGLPGPSGRRDGYATERTVSMPTLEEQFEGYEDSVILGTMVAIWRCVGLSRRSPAEVASLLCDVALVYAVMWLACLWASL